MTADQTGIDLVIVAVVFAVLNCTGEQIHILALTSPNYILFRNCARYHLQLSHIFQIMHHSLSIHQHNEVLIRCAIVDELTTCGKHTGDDIVFLLPLFIRNDGLECRLTIILSITSVTAFMSWVLAGGYDKDSGIPFLYIKTCFFVPSLLVSTGGLLSVIGPLLGNLSIYCQQAIAIFILFPFFHHVILAH